MNTVKMFFEKYDADAFKSIDNLVDDFKLITNVMPIDGFDFVESVDLMKQFLEGYCEYLTTTPVSELKSVEDMENTISPFIDGRLFSESKINIAEIPDTIKLFAEAVDTIIDMEDSLAGKILTESLDPAYAGVVSLFNDKFTKRFSECMDMFLENVLLASGYNHQQAVKEIIGKNRSSSDKVIFA